MTEEDGDNRRRNTSRINNKHKHSHFYRTLTVTQSDPVRVCPCHTYTEMVQQIHVLPPYIPVSVAHPLCCVCLLLQDSCLCTTAAPGADPSHLNASDIYLDCTTAGGGGRGVSRWCASSRCRFPMMTPLPIWDALTSRALQWEPCAQDVCGICFGVWMKWCCLSARAEDAGWSFSLPAEWCLSKGDVCLINETTLPSRLTWMKLKGQHKVSIMKAADNSSTVFFLTFL